MIRRSIHEHGKNQVDPGNTSQPPCLAAQGDTSLDRSFVILTCLIKVLTSDNESTTSRVSVYMRDGDSAREPVDKIKRLYRQRLKKPRSVYKLSNYDLR